MRIIILTIAIALAALAEEPKPIQTRAVSSIATEEPTPSTPSAKPPTIPAEQEITYWRAIAQANQAAEQTRIAQEAVKAATAKIVAACGEKYQPQDQMDAQGKPSGRLVCVEKPQAKEAGK